MHSANARCNGVQLRSRRVRLHSRLHSERSCELARARSYAASRNARCPSRLLGRFPTLMVRPAVATPKLLRLWAVENWAQIHEATAWDVVTGDARAPDCWSHPPETRGKSRVRCQRSTMRHVTVPPLGRRIWRVWR